MVFLEKLLERVFGKFHIYITVGKKPVIEVIFEDSTIILDIKNPILAIEAGIEQMLSRRGKITFSSQRLEGLKKMGFKIKIRFKGIEFEI